ncbi:LOB domain-containing protein 38-like [Ananas comosus]|uniref:LOB domain-containing protein 38-like n=2 Tax=Ananas comosus TaxID=4615 RepID=A0A6P5FGT7_ANACO|nr:LOB domain-containing protein 38-like [Ananas comosus]
MIMSCNGCRVLRKGCSDTCILRPCLERITDGPQAQAHATLFVAKFFGRASLLSLLSTVPSPSRPALFRSLLYEACGRTINPVNGASGLLWTGNWDRCQAAVDTVLCRGALRPLPDIGATAADMGDLYGWCRSAEKKRSELTDDSCDLELYLMQPRMPRLRGDGEEVLSSEGSVTTADEGCDGAAVEQRVLLNLFS